MTLRCPNRTSWGRQKKDSACLKLSWSRTRSCWASRRQASCPCVSPSWLMAPALHMWRGETVFRCFENIPSHLLASHFLHFHVCGVCRHTCTVPCPLAPVGTHHVPLSSPSFARQDFVHHARACLLLQCKKLFHSCLVFYTFFVFVPGRKMWPPSRTVPYVYCTKSNTKASFFLLLKYLLLVQVPEMHICGHETHLGPLRGGETAQI